MWYFSTTQVSYTSRHTLVSLQIYFLCLSMELVDFIALFASFPLFPPFSCPFFSHFSFISFSPSLLLLSCYDFDVTLLSHLRGIDRKK